MNLSCFIFLIVKRRGGNWGGTQRGRKSSNVGLYNCDRWRRNYWKSERRMQETNILVVNNVYQYVHIRNRCC